MTYRKVVPAVFRARPNRFLAVVEIGGDGGPTETVHVKNTGRCRELLVPGYKVWLSASDNPARKTGYDLIAVEKERPGTSPLLINLDSQAPNDAAEEWLRAQADSLFGKGAVIRREVVHGKSRFDFCIEAGGRTTFLEVKGCTLEEDGVALFPDAPTERGVKHLRELTSCLGEGYGAALLIVIQMKEMRLFRPNDRTHRAFGDALREAAEAGVTILAADCLVTPGSMTIDAPVPVDLRPIR